MPKKSIIISIILISIFLSGCGVIPEPPEPNGIAYRAFFVGVGDYIYYESWDLYTAAPNTVKLKSLFSQCKFGKEEIEFTIIERLVDRNATKENILNGILETFAGADDNDVSYFYYMGHGGTRSNIPMITPSDYRSTLESCITVHELEEHLSMIPGTKVVFLETCHSGNFIDKGNDFNDMVINIFSQQSMDLINKESYQVLTCGKGEQYCYTWSTWSYFCRAILLGCEDLNADINGDKIIDLTELHTYVKEWIKMYPNARQDVQIYPDDSTFPIVEY